MKKLLYADSKGLTQSKLRVGFIATEDSFMTYRHPILVEEDDLKLGESVTKSIVVYHVGKDSDVIILKDEALMRVKDLSKVMSHNTRVNINIIGNTNENIGGEGSLGFFSRTVEGKMIIANMKFDKDILKLDVYDVSLEGIA